MGDANMCQTKWNESNYVYKNVYNVLKSTLERNDLRINNIGTTYKADHEQRNNTIAESSLDHVYNSNALNNKLKIVKLKNSFSDHVPVLTQMEKNNNESE